MENAFLFCYALGIVMGVLVGIAFTIRKKPEGKLLVDVSDPDKDRYMIEIDIPLDDVPKKKKLVLKVESSNLGSQEIQPL